MSARRDSIVRRQSFATEVDESDSFEHDEAGEPSYVAIHEEEEAQQEQEEEVDAFAAQRALGMTPAPRRPVRRALVPGMEAEDAFAAQRNLGVTPAGPKPARRAVVPGMDADDAFAAQRLGLQMTPAAVNVPRPGPPRASAVRATVVAARVPLPPSTGKKPERRRSLLEELGQVCVCMHVFG